MFDYEQLLRLAATCDQCMLTAIEAAMSNEASPYAQRAANFAIVGNRLREMLKDYTPSVERLTERDRPADEYSSNSPGYHDQWGPGGRHS